MLRGPQDSSSATHMSATRPPFPPPGVLCGPPRHGWPGGVLLAARDGEPSITPRSVLALALTKRTNPFPRSPTTQYIRGSSCYVIVYDITSRSSFEEARLMRQFILRVRDEDVVYIVRAHTRCKQEHAEPDAQALPCTRLPHLLCLLSPCS